jgi:hypothetical protein
MLQEYKGFMSATLPPKRPSEQPVSLALEKSAAALEKDYQCKSHPNERVKFYC